jgi:hypothetical protein
MTEREALVDLLEAVDLAIYSGDWKVDGACDPDAAIQRARKALAQPEQEPVVFNTLASLKHKKTVGPIESAMSNTTQSQPETWENFCDSNCVWTDHHPDCKLAQPEQKPVVAGWLRIVQGHTGFVAAETEWGAEKPEKAGMWIPLYITPPQRKPLTDEQKGKLANAWFSKDGDTDVAHRKAIALIEEVEAAHGIKELA